jgi:hypothetical protein
MWRKCVKLGVVQNTSRIPHSTNYPTKHTLHKITDQCAHVTEVTRHKVIKCQFPDEEGRDGPRNVGLLATQPPDTAARCYNILLKTSFPSKT